VSKNSELLLKKTQLLEENDHFFQKNTKTAKNKVFAPKNHHFQLPKNPKIPFKPQYQGAHFPFQNPKTKATNSVPFVWNIRVLIFEFV